jgi:protein-S-isoprenylcysteine O-methyltransferase Ste14
MALVNEMRDQGETLFRWRSYYPMVFFALLLFAMKETTRPEDTLYWHFSWKMFCLTIAFFGQIIRVFTVGFVLRNTSGRNTREQKAEALNTTGIYSTVRHPLYLGNYFAGLGIALFPGIWWLAIIYTLSFWVYYERIMFAEESFLRGKFGEPYDEWAARTPAFWPKFSQLTKPELNFSLRTVLRREYPGFFAIVFTFTLLEVVESLFSGGSFMPGPFWVKFFLIGLALYLSLLALKRKTRLLKVSGR